MSKTSRKFHVPDGLAHAYDFANTLDLRRFVEHGVRHEIIPVSIVVNRQM